MWAIDTGGSSYVFRMIMIRNYVDVYVARSAYDKWWNE